MNWTVKISSKADKYFQKLDKSKRERFKEELKGLAEYKNPLEHPAVKPLTGKFKDFLRLRIGDYRIIFSIIPEDKIIAIVNIAPRGNVYQ